MNDQLPPKLLEPMPLVQLPSPPADFTEAITVLRVACTKRAPWPGVSEHKTEAQAYDNVLDRNVDRPLSIAVGVVGAIAVVCLIMLASRRTHALARTIQNRCGATA